NGGGGGERAWAGTKLGGQSRKMERGRTGAAGDRMDCTSLCSECPLKGLDARAGGEEVAAQNLDDRRDVVIIDRLAPIRKKGAAVHWEWPAISVASADSSSHSGLRSE